MNAFSDVEFNRANSKVCIQSLSERYLCLPRASGDLSRPVRHVLLLQQFCALKTRVFTRGVKSYVCPVTLPQLLALSWDY